MIHGVFYLSYGGYASSFNNSTGLTSKAFAIFPNVGKLPTEPFLKILVIVAFDNLEYKAKSDAL